MYKRQEIILGIKYESLEEILNFISNEIDYKLTPLNNLTDQEATQLTSLEGKSFGESPKPIILIL